MSITAESRDHTNTNKLLPWVSPALQVRRIMGAEAPAA